MTDFYRKKYSREFRLEKEVETLKSRIKDMERNEARFAALALEAMLELGASKDWIFKKFGREVIQK